jgi:agmatine deiminase
VNASPNPRRRQALAAAAAGLAAVAAGVGCSGLDGGKARPQEAPAPPAPPADTAAGFRTVGEFEPMRAVWLGYDPGHAALTAQLAAALQSHVQLRLLVAEAPHVDAARTLLAGAGVNTARVQFDVDREAIYFVRDAAVFSRGPASQLGLLDFRWSHYGLATWCQRRYAAEPARAAACAAAAADAGREELDRRMARLAGARVYSSSLFMEGGGIEFNGAGVALVSEPLAQQRNPGVPRAQLQAAFEALPGVRKVIWLSDGLASDPHLRGTITGNYVAWGTGGHTDEFVRFADARTVLLAWPDDADVAAHPVARLNRQRMQRNFDILAAATDAGPDGSNKGGQPFRIIKLPVPRAVERRIFLSAAADERFSADWTADFFPPGERRREGQPVIQLASSSYLNFVVANGVVVVPGYEAHGTPRAVEQRLRGQLQQAFPGRQIVFVDAIGANWVGGGPHCATLNEPQV